MKFDNPDEILEILLCSDKSYDELLEYCEVLYSDINEPHQSSLGNVYSSKFTQCILECFKHINKFTSTIWYPTKYVDKNILKDDSVPIEFYRPVSDGKMINYKLYNRDQILNPQAQDFDDDEQNDEDKEDNIAPNTEETETQLQNYIEKINDIIISSNGWISIREIAKLMKTDARQYLIQNTKNSTIAQLINRFLKKQNIQTCRIDYEKSYEIYCADKSFSKESLPKEFLESACKVNWSIDKQVSKEETSNKLKYSTVDEDIEKKNLHVKRAILACIKEFSGKYGKSGIAKILKGSKGLKDNSYNNEAANSSFYGMFEQMTLSFLEKQIDELIDEKYIKIQKLGNFSRPALSISQEGEDYYIKIQDINETASEPDEFYQSEIFIKIADYIEQGANIFITGHAGTGKSFILNRLKEKYKEIVITSTTGIAAVNVKGQTLHSWAGVGICNYSIDYTVKKILSKNALTKKIRDCKILAIDEISMLSVATFEYVDKVLRIIRNCEKPYGGIQVILIGDFFQLPPVEKDTVTEKKYCFESPIWKEMDLKNIILTKNYRQNEEDLIQALSHMRTNNLTEEDIKLLKTREITKTPSIDNILHIYSTNEEADNYNQKMFNLINSKEYSLISFDGIYKGKKLIDTPETERDKLLLNRIDLTCRAEKNIVLKIGARVMLLANLDFEQGLINGTCGVVEDVCDDYVLVLFDNNTREKIKQHDFEFYNNNELIAVRKQYPLRLAYGITIHKSQGMSLDNLVVDCSRIFEKGQAYVALSRIKKLSGLYLCNFNPTSVMVDEKVAAFYKDLTQSN